MGVWSLKVFTRGQSLDKMKTRTSLKQSLQYDLKCEW